MRYILVTEVMNERLPTSNVGDLSWLWIGKFIISHLLQRAVSAVTMLHSWIIWVKVKENGVNTVILYPLQEKCIHWVNEITTLAIKFETFSDHWLGFLLFSFS